MNVTLTLPPSSSPTATTPARPPKAPEPRPSRRPRDRATARQLTFAPLAWLKLQFFLHAGETEVGGFGVSAGHDPLYVADFVTVAQRTTAVTVAFDDAAVADHFDAMADRGIAPARCGRVWIHTHPGASPDPSWVDEHTFDRVFGARDWAVMFVAARGGRTYARLRFTAGPGGEVTLPVAVDWAAWAQVVCDHGSPGDTPSLAELTESWMDEYGTNVWPEFEPLVTALRPSAGDRDVLGTVPADRDLIPAWDGDWWELDPELAALAQMEAELEDERRRAGPDDPFWRSYA